MNLWKCVVIIVSLSLTDVRMFFGREDAAS